MAQNKVTMYIASDDRRNKLDNRVFVVINTEQQKKNVTRAYLTYVMRAGLMYRGEVKHLTSEADILELLSREEKNPCTVLLPKKVAAKGLYQEISLFQLNERIFDSTRTEPNPISLALGDKVLVDPGIIKPWTHPPKFVREVKPRPGYDYCVITFLSSSGSYGVNGSAWFSLEELIFLGRADYESYASALRESEDEDEDEEDEDEDED